MPEDTGRSRPLWSGTISFGLVSVPVDLLPGTRSNRTSLRMVTPEGKPLARRYFAHDGRALSSDDLVRGYEVEKDRFVVVEDEELERLAPDRSRDIDLRVFVDAGEIDPIHFDRPYYLVPSGGSTKAYRLLARVMEETQRAGIATFVMRGKEYLVAILAENGILRAETLRFSEEIRSAEDVGLPEPASPPEREVKALIKGIRARAEERLDPEELVEETTERLRRIAEKKTGKPARRAAAGTPASDAAVIDLMERLQRSLKGAGGGSTPARGDGDLRERPKPELYERAQALDIPGRSGMTKEELIEALEEAERG